MSVRVAYSNQKGGVLKTTLSTNNAVCGVKTGKRTCFIDLDGGQGNGTYFFGYNPVDIQKTVFTWIAGKSTFEETKLPTYYDPKSGIFFDPRNKTMMERLDLSSLAEAERGPDVIPNNTEMSDISEALLADIPEEEREFLLRKRLDEIDSLYDEIHMDTGPSLGKAVWMMFLAATDIVIPTIGENLAIQGLILLSKKLAEAKLKNSDLSIAGILFSRVRYRSHREIIQFVEKKLVQQINSYFDMERLESPEKYDALAGLEMSCFSGTIGESAEFGNVTNVRANILLASPLHVSSIEHWQCYVELLRKIQGPGLLEASKHYNMLAQQYNEKLEEEERKKVAVPRKRAR